MATSLTTGANGAVGDPFAGLFSGGGLQGLTQLLQAAFGGSGSQNSNQNSMNSSTSGTNAASSSSSKTQSDQILQALTDAMRSSTSSGSSASETTGTTGSTSAGSSSSTSESPLALQALAQVLPQLQAAASSNQFSRENAIKDSQGGVMELFRNLQENALPGVFAAENATGGYNSTSKKLLSNDLMSRTVAQGQTLIADNVARYGTLQNQSTNNLLNAINAAANASRTTTGTTNGVTTGTTNSATTGTTNNQTNENSSSTVNQTGSTNTSNTTEGTNSSTTNSQSLGNVATTGESKNSGLVSNPGVQTAAGVIAALSGLSSLGLTPSAIATLARSLGYGAASVNTDGTINWGSFSGSGGEGGFVGDTTDPTQGFGAPSDPPAFGGDLPTGDLGGHVTIDDPSWDFS